MLKVFFWLLLLANGVLFALHQGYLGGSGDQRHEPARMNQQLHADQLKLLSERSAAAGIAPLLASTAPEQAARAAAPGIACIEIGDFEAADSRRFETQLGELGLKGKSSARETAETASYMVYIAPGGKEALAGKIAELRQLGVNEFFVLPQSSTLHGGISLGVFKTEDGAKTLLATLTRKGVRGARISARGGAAGKQVFQLRGLEGDEQAAFDRLRAEFPEQRLQPCAGAADGQKAG